MGLRASAEGDLESYLETHPERKDSLKIKCMSSIIETLLMSTLARYLWMILFFAIS